MRKQMRFWAVRLMTFALFSILIAGCYNDDELWDEVKVQLDFHIQVHILLQRR